MANLRREAWKAYFRGDYLRAGDLYKSAGDLDKASRMFIKAKDFRAAAEAEEELGRVSAAVDLLLRMGDPISAAQMLGRHGQCTRGAQILAEAGNKVQAAAMALKGGHALLASNYYEQAGRFMEAGRLAFRDGNVARALLTFEKALKQRPGIEALTPAEQLQHREELTEIAHYFEESEAYDRAAAIHEELGNVLQAAQCYEAAKQYEKAIELYTRIGASDRVAALTDVNQQTPLEVQAETLAARGETEEAARLMVRAGFKERAAALFESAGNLAASAELRRDLGDFELAGNLFFRAQAFLPAAECYREAGLHTMAEQCYLKAGDGRMASRMAFEGGLFERSLELAPDDAEREMLLARLQSLPENPLELTRLGVLKGRIFVELNQPKVALACVEALPPSRGAEELWRLYVLGRSQESLGRMEMATEAYQKILASDLAFQDTRARLDALTRSPRPQAGPDRYLAVRPIHSDGFGHYFRGEDTSLAQPVTLYRLAQDSSGPDASCLQRLMGLSHPNVMTLKDAVATPGVRTLIYEAFEGRPLTQWLAEGYRPSLYSILEKLRQVLSALGESHGRDVFHGHLSPATVWLDAEGHVKVSSLGIARPAEAVSARGDDTAPIVAAGQAPSPGASAPGDLADAARLFLHLTTGQEVTIEQARGLIPTLDLPSAVRNVVLRLLGLDSSVRYAAAEEALTDLAAQELPPGAIVAGRYEILEELGRGGMGQVFRVRDRELDEVVALKTLRRRTDLNEETRTRFLREIKLSRRITHPNVVRVFDLGSWRDMMFLTMEFIPGKTLSQWVRDGDNRSVNLRQKIEILRGISAGLEEAHRIGIIHRDLKPQNVILTPGGVPKLLDFGIALARHEEGTELTQEGHFVGSPKYVSPEQIQGAGLTARSDIYAFGLLAYFVLTGQDAFTGDKSTLIILKQLKEMPAPPSGLARMPPSLESLVMRCLQKAPESRPESLSEVSKSLKEIV